MPAVLPFAPSVLTRASLTPSSNPLSERLLSWKMQTPIVRTSWQEPEASSQINIPFEHVKARYLFFSLLICKNQLMLFAKEAAASTFFFFFFPL